MMYTDYFVKMFEKYRQILKERHILGIANIFVCDFERGVIVLILRRKLVARDLIRLFIYRVILLSKPYNAICISIEIVR